MKFEKNNKSDVRRLKMTIQQYVLKIEIEWKTSLQTAVKCLSEIHEDRWVVKEVHLPCCQLMWVYLPCQGTNLCLYQLVHLLCPILHLTLGNFSTIWLTIGDPWLIKEERRSELSVWCVDAYCLAYMLTKLLHSSTSTLMCHLLGLCLLAVLIISLSFPNYFFFRYQT